MALTALGVVFGDIGTSPLYAFQVALLGVGHSAPSAAEILGIVSLILLALTAMVSLKYVIFVLRGVFSLTRRIRFTYLPPIGY